MAANPRSDSISSAPDASFFHSSSFLNGHRSSYSSGGLERSGNFRETMENRPSSSTSMPSIEIPSPSSYLTTAQLSLGEMKCTRTSELKRIFGISHEENLLRTIQCKPLIPSAVEELKRLKASIIEAASKARERTRMLLDSSTKLERYIKLISKKRQRTGIQSSQNSPDLNEQRQDDRAKNSPPNKRFRSTVEIRAEGRYVMPSKDKNTLIDKDKNMLRPCNGVSVPAMAKMRTFSFSGEACESKVKKKRSVGAVGNRQAESDREMKGVVQRLNNEIRHRNSVDPTFRDDLGGTIPSTDAREQLATAGKDLNPSKSGDNIHENAQNGGPRTLVKGKSFRGPRSIPSSSMNASQNFQRMPGLPDALNQPPILNKVHQINEINKRPLSEWGGQRPLKNTRTRRMNVISPVSNHDDVSSPTDGQTQCLQQVKLKFGSISIPDGLISIENKSKEKVQKIAETSGEPDVRVMNGVQKIAAMMVPSKKSKLSNGEEVAKRHGRGGRTGISETVNISKPPVPGKPDSEIRVGRPPLRKALDRRASNRCTGFSNQLDESYDDHDDLVAAANLARDARYQSCSGSLWKEVDQLFSCISDKSLAFLKEQMEYVEDVDVSLSRQNLMGDFFHKMSDPIDQEKWLQGFFPLSQMLLAAFIVEEETEVYYDDQDNYNGSIPNGDDDSFQHESACLDDRILMELKNIGLVPDQVQQQVVKEDIDKELQELNMKLHEQTTTRKHLLRRLIKAVEADREEEERNLEKIAMDKLVELAYKKCLRGRGGHGSSQKSGTSRVARQMAQAFAQRVLARCHKFEATGLSCFSDSTFRAILSLGFPDCKPIDTAHQEPPSTGSIHNKSDSGPAKMPPPRSTAFSGSTKGKRSERDGTASRTLLAIPNRQLETTTMTAPTTICSKNSSNHNNSSNNNNNDNNEKPREGTEKSRGKEEEAMDLINLPLDSIDGLGEQAQDLGSWLTVDDVILQDDDLMMGLEIPMDDLSDLHMSMNF